MFVKELQKRMYGSSCFLFGRNVSFPCYKYFKSVTYFRLKWRTIGRSGGNVEKFRGPVPRQWKVMQRRRNIHMERGMSVD